MGQEALAQVLRPLAGMFEPGNYPDLLRGLDSPDDAAVWRLDDERAVVVTADFFPPIVDDPHDFGSIAAANALSDLYAMGAEPLFGINLVAFPSDLDGEILSEILRGGAEKMREAGAVVAGGHSTTDKEPKYGLAVVGMLRPEQVLTKGGARAGDVLLLTKPLGTGVITTALRKGKAAADHLQSAVESMARLNGGASRVLRDAAPATHACTDVTGFGLIGHGHEMASQSGLTLRIRVDALPWLPGAEEYARRGFLTGGAGRTREFSGRHVRWTAEVEGWVQDLMFDPQTSGGLLAAVDPDGVDAVLQGFQDAGERVWRIGEAVEGPAGGIEVVRG